MTTTKVLISHAVSELCLQKSRKKNTFEMPHNVFASNTVL